MSDSSESGVDSNPIRTPAVQLFAEGEDVGVRSVLGAGTRTSRGLGEAAAQVHAAAAVTPPDHTQRLGEIEARLAIGG